MKKSHEDLVVKGGLDFFPIKWYIFPLNYTC